MPYLVYRAVCDERLIAGMTVSQRANEAALSHRLALYREGERVAPSVNVSCAAGTIAKSLSSHTEMMEI